VPDNLVLPRTKIDLIKDELQFLPFLASSGVEGSPEPESRGFRTSSGNKKLRIVTNTEQAGEGVLKRPPTHPEIEPEQGAFPIKHQVFGSQLEKMLNFV
jgi:hypothetical protein